MKENNVRFNEKVSIQTYLYNDNMEIQKNNLERFTNMTNVLCADITKTPCHGSPRQGEFYVVVFRGEGSDLVNGLVVAIVDAVAALNALDVIDGELLLFFHNGAVGAFGFRW